MSSDVPDRKAALRAAVLAARARRSDADRDAAETALARHGVATWRSATTVAAYLSFGTEPPTRRLVDDLAAEGVDVLVPVITGAVLEWARHDGPASLATGPLGIPQPTGHPLGPEALTRADVVVVPALSVDRAGHRLGRGRGYYDRALAAVTAPLVAVIYDDELVDEVPVERHDQSVGAVLRPGGLTSLS